MLTEYLDAAMSHAEYELLEDDQHYYGEIPGFQGVYAHCPTLEECRAELREVLEEWLFLKISMQLEVPEIDGLALPIPKAS